MTTLRRTKPFSLFRRSIIVLLVGFIFFLLYIFVSGLIAKNSGPFAYFKDETGNKTAYERGHAQIAEWIKNGNDGARAIEQGRKAGFECLSLKSHHYPGAEPNTKSGGCRYVMGLIWGVWYFGVQTDNNGMIIHSFQDIAPPIGL